MIARRLAAAALLAVVVLSGCGRPGPSKAGGFDDQPGSDAVTCLVHQRSGPDPAYGGGPRANTLLVLTMLHYYVANGNKPYCDGRPPGEMDRAWVDAYLRLGADPAHVVRYAKPVPPTPATPAIPVEAKP
jgi:hypothetical protein